MRIRLGLHTERLVLSFTLGKVPRRLAESAGFERDKLAFVELFCDSLPMCLSTYRDIELDPLGFTTMGLTPFVVGHILNCLYYFLL